MKSTFTKFITVLLFCSLNEVEAQNIGINGTGANPNASALLDIDDAGSNNKGLLIPRIPLTAINAAAPVTSPATSLLVYNTASASTGTNAVSPGYYYWDGTKWVRFAYSASGSSANDWNILGNVGTNPTTNFLGTTDAQDLVFRTNNTFVAKFRNNGTFTNSLLNQNILDATGTGGNPGSLLWEFNNGGYAVGIANQSNIAQSNGLVIKTVSTASNTSILDLSTGTQTLSGISVMSVKGNGNVGIGTSTPVYPLHVVLPDNGNLNGVRFEGLRSIAGGHAVRLELMGLNSPATANKKNFQITNSTPADASQNRLFFTSVNDAQTTLSNYLLTLEHDGNVGINTPSPLEKLHVFGGNAVIADNLKSNFNVNRTGQFLYVDNIKGWSDNGVRIYDGNTNGYLDINNVSDTYIQSHSIAGAASNILNESGGAVDNSYSNISLNPYGGNVGIGTTAPTQKLHVKEGFILLDNTTVSESALILSNNNTGLNSNASIQFRNQAGNVWTNYMGGPTGYAGVEPNALEWWEYPFSQMSNSGTCCLTRFRIQPNNTGVGYATVVIDGSGQMYGNGWAQPSDKTLKTNIKPLTNALDKISKLGGYSYNFTKESNLDDGKVHIGVIAQEVEAVLPEAVSQFPNASYKAINYDALIPLQIEAIKELREENIKQQELISELLKRIETLEKK